MGKQEDFEAKLSGRMVARGWKALRLVENFPNWSCRVVEGEAAKALGFSMSGRECWVQPKRMAKALRRLEMREASERAKAAKAGRRMRGGWLAAIEGS